MSLSSHCLEKVYNWLVLISHTGRAQCSDNNHSICNAYMSNKDHVFTCFMLICAVTVLQSDTLRGLWFVFEFGKNRV